MLLAIPASFTDRAFPSCASALHLAMSAMWRGLSSVVSFPDNCAYRYNTPYEEEATSVFACFAKLLRSLDWVERQRIGELDSELAKASSA